MTRSTIEGNRAGLRLGTGGGIANRGAAMLVAVTVSFNGTPDFGGGISNGGTLVLVNVTVSGNAARFGGGVSTFFFGTTVLANSTVSDNSGLEGGGISGPATLTNTIVGRNSATTGPNCGQPVTSAGHNVSSDLSCGLAGSGDLSATDPKLGPLANNGGPTATYALLPGSPAIDAGDESNCPATDQRGQPRPLDGDGDGRALCDIGTFEVAAAVLPRLTVALNQAMFRPGDMLILTADLTPGSIDILVDAYIRLWAPDGQPFSLRSDGTVIAGVVPIATAFVPSLFTGEVFRFTIQGDEPPGPYTWFGELRRAATDRTISSSDGANFTLSR